MWATQTPFFLAERRLSGSVDCLHRHLGLSLAAEPFRKLLVSLLPVPA